MKIALEVQRLFRRKKHGMEIVAYEIIRQLQKSELANQYLLFAKDDSDNAFMKDSRNLSITILAKTFYPVWEQLRLPNALKKAKPDVLHCMSNTAPLFSSIPLIVTIHDVIYMESVGFSGSSYQNFGNLYRRFIVPKVARKAALVLTVSEYEKNVIVTRLNIAEDKVRVIYNGVNKQFKPILDPETLGKFRAEYNLPDKFLLHFANTAPKKNTSGVLAAYKLYFYGEPNPLPLVLTDCNIEYVRSLLKKIDAEELLKYIQILDYIPFTSIPYLYNLANIFLYPSHRESFGMPLIESMACGIPVITSNTSALPEIAGGAACLVDPEKPQEMYDQIKKLLADGSFYNEQREKGFKNATRFSWENSARATESAYQELSLVSRPQTKPLTLQRILATFKLQLHTGLSRKQIL